MEDDLRHFGRELLAHDGSTKPERNVFVRRKGEGILFGQYFAEAAVVGKVIDVGHRDEDKNVKREM